MTFYKAGAEEKQQGQDTQHHSLASERDGTLNQDPADLLPSDVEKDGPHKSLTVKAGLGYSEENWESANYGEDSAGEQRQRRQREGLQNSTQQQTVHLTSSAVLSTEAERLRLSTHSHQLLPGDFTDVH